MTALPEQIRAAVRAGDYAGASQLFAEYARTAPLDESNLRTTEELLHWVKVEVECVRTQLEARARTLRGEAHALAAYGR